MRRWVLVVVQIKNVSSRRLIANQVPWHRHNQLIRGRCHRCSLLFPVHCTTLRYCFAAVEHLAGLRFIDRNVKNEHFCADKKSMIAKDFELRCSESTVIH